MNALESGERFYGYADNLSTFARERDRMYVIMTLIVLAVLLYSLLAG